MKVRPVDGYGDMMPVYESSQMLTGAEAVAQVAKERLLFFKGEWWEDENLGVAIPEFLASNVKARDVNLFGKFITSYIAQTEGVTAVTNANIEFVNKKLIFSCVLKTTEGNASVEVDLSGLL